MTTTPQKHAVLSPSSAHRWMACPGSVALEAGIPSTSSKYSDEGTAAHDIAAKALLAGGLMPVCPNREMGRYVGNYVEAVLRSSAGHTLLVEQQLDLEPITGEMDAKGTADAVIITSDGKELQVHDLKYGMGVEVYAEDNPQLMIYGLAALQQYAMFGDFERVRLVIHQVRLTDMPDDWEISVEDLLAFGEEVKMAAIRAIAIKDAQQQGIPLGLSTMNPGDKQCRFCKAKSTCPALAATAIEGVTGKQVSFDEFIEAPQAIVTATRMVTVAEADKLARLLPLVPLIRDWCKSIEDRVQLSLAAGEVIPGFKLVEGKRGSRSWSDEGEVEAIMQGMRLNHDQMYASKLISPTQAEKAFADVNPRRWARLQEYIERQDGKPVVVSETDKRPALVVDNTQLFVGMTDAE